MGCSSKERAGDCAPRYTRAQTAAEIGATPEAVRGWERSGLVGARARRYDRVRFSEDDLSRMRVIHLLVTCGYSLQAVLESLSGEGVLIAPEIGKELVSVNDCWMQSLGDAALLADKMREAAQNLKTLPLHPTFENGD